MSRENFSWRRGEGYGAWCELGKEDVFCLHGSGLVGGWEEVGQWLVGDDW